VSNPASSGLYGVADAQHPHVLKQSDHVAAAWPVSFRFASKPSRLNPWKMHSWESQSLRKQMLRANRQLPNSLTG
jgi:hypothetical protein